MNNIDAATFLGEYASHNGFRLMRRAPITPVQCKCVSPSICPRARYTRYVSKTKRPTFVPKLYHQPIFRPHKVDADAKPCRCRAELFLKVVRPSTAEIWSPPPPTPPVQLLTTSPNPASPPELSHPQLLARMAELHTIDYAGIFDDEPGPGAEAFKLQHLITLELAQDAAAADRPRAIPTSVLDDAIISLSRQIGRLHNYHRLRWRHFTWTPSVEDLRDPDQARDFADNLYDVVYIERRERRLRAEGLLPEI